MLKLPAGRISGRALKALVSAARKTPVRHVLAKVLRGQLGIDAALALGRDARGDLPFSHAPVLARCDHDRPSLGLGIPTTDSWPRTIGAYERAFAARRIPPDELAERSLSAARELACRKPSLGPLLEFDDERALEAARESKRRLAAGKARSELEGVVVAIKEEVDVEGLSTRLGTGFLPAVPASADSTAVARLRAAGAVIIGSTPMTEYGMSPLGGNVHRTMPRNAHSPDHLPGGSSSGSAVAVATGIVPVALGSDGGGSIRIPAALNGIFGLKPTYGRVPVVGGGLPGGSSVVHLGPLGTCSYDLAVFLEISAGSDARDPPSVGQPLIDPGELVTALGRGVRGLRIGVDDDEWDSASPDVRAAGRTALAALEREGATLVPVSIRLARNAAAIGYLTLGLEVYANLADVRRAHMDDLGADLQLLLANLQTFGADDYIDAQRLRAELRREVAEILGDVDVLALPTTSTTAPAVTDHEAFDGFIDPPALDAMCRFAFLGNLTGLPAGTAPIAMSGGLPIGLQIIGDAWDEACVLQVLAHLERIGQASVVRPAAGYDLLEG